MRENKRRGSSWLATWVAILLTVAFLLLQPNKTLAQCQWTSGTGTITQTCGNVGIGTTTPLRLLEISGNSNPGLKITNSGIGGAFLLYTRNGNGVLSGRQLTIYDENAGVDRFLLDGSGNFGFSTLSPANRLHIYTTASNDGLSLDGTTHPGMNFRNAGTIKGYFGLATGVNGWATGSSINDVVIRTEDSTNGNILFATQAGSLVPMKITRGGTIGIATTNPDPAYKLHVAGSVLVDGNIAAKYQDVAEWVPASRAILAGTVVVLDADQSNHVLPSIRAYDTRVAGVVSEKPGVILGEGGEGKVMVATTGRVRVKVDATNAPIRVGDLLVTSDKEGIAMRSQPLDLGGTPIHRPGTLIGKALEPLEKGVGEILVLLSLQ